MPGIVRKYENKNEPIVTENNDVLSMTYLNIVKLNKGDNWEEDFEDFESCHVVMKGNCDIKVDGKLFGNVGRRKDIWSGKADSVYVPINSKVVITANQDETEIAVAGGKFDKKMEAFRIKPEDVEYVDVGSNDTHSHRRIFHILGQNAEGRAGNLLISELYCDGGCWSGYPSHKHDEDAKSDDGFEETGFEELYHYRFNPENGFGAQLVYQPDGQKDCYMTQSGDTVLIDKGYHPTVTSPGHQEYIFTVLVGHTQRSLIQNFREDHRYLMDKIPGIGNMRDKFK